MAVVTLPTLVGEQNAGGDDRVLHLKVWSGEVITQFEKTTIMKSMVTTRRITSGKSATFPVLGRAKAVFHVPGENILTDATGATYLSQILANERVILIDNLLTSSVLLGDLDEAMSHYDVRAPLTAELGQALARQYDIHAMSKLWDTAAEASLLTPGDEDPVGGSITLTASAIEATGPEWLAAFMAAALNFDKNSVPTEQRFFLCAPDAYYSIVNNSDMDKFIDRDFAGQGSFAEAKWPKIAGFSIIKTELFPTTDQGAAATGDLNDYSADMDLAIGVFGHPSAIGTVQLMDVGLQAEYKIEYQGTLVVSRYASGTGTLRPASAIQLLVPVTRWY